MGPPAWRLTDNILAGIGHDNGYRRFRVSLATSPQAMNLSCFLQQLDSLHYILTGQQHTLIDLRTRTKSAQV